MKTVLISLLFLTWTAACGGQKDSLSKINGQSEDTVSQPNNHITLLYWDNKNLGFGHVATEIYSGEKSEPSYYISYAMGNVYEVDREKHGKDPVRLVLPMRSNTELQQFEEWLRSSPYIDPFTEEYSRDYSMLKHNCAHAALDVLRAFGYKLPIEGQAPFALRPWQVFKAAKQYIEENSNQI